MADPFSITLSALSLVSALKDVVDLAQALNESFEKISRNQKRNAQLSSLTLERLNRLKDFCEKNAESLETADDLKHAIEDLRREIKSVYDRTEEFVSIPKTGRLRRVKPIIKAWMKRNTVEDDIIKLDNRIKECESTFSMFALLRIEALTRQISSSKTKERKLSLGPGAQGSEGLHHMSYGVASLGISGKSQSLSFAKSAATTDTISLSGASVQLIAEMYLRSKIHCIDASLTKLARSQMFPVEEPMKYFTLPFSSIYSFRVLPADHLPYRESAVTTALSISAVLQRHHMSLSMQHGAIDMVRLSNKLIGLDMIQEGLTIGRWAADMFRTMVNSGPVVYQPYFCMALHNLATHQRKAGNITDASNTNAACLKLSRELTAAFGTHEIRVQLATALTASSGIARMSSDHMKALNDATEAISILEDIFKNIADWQGFDSVFLLSERFDARKGDGRDPPSAATTDVIGASVEGAVNSDNIISTRVEPDPGLVEGKTDNQSTTVNIKTDLRGVHKYIYDYGRALQEQSSTYYALERYKEASESGLRSLNIMKRIDLLYPLNFLSSLAAAYYQVSLRKLRDYIPAKDALVYGKKGVDLYRDISKESRSFSLSYYNAMQAYATTLGDFKRYDEALDISQEMARVAKEIMDDKSKLADSFRDISANLRLLGREDEATSLQNQSVEAYRMVFKATSRHEGESLRKLSAFLHDAGWYLEAVQACQEAVVHYRILAIDDGLEDIKGLADALTWLAWCFDALKDYNQALNEGYEALQLLEGLANNEPSVLPLYLEALRINLYAMFGSDDEPKSMERTQYCLRQYHRMFELYPGKVRDLMPWAFKMYMNKLEKHHRIQEAIEWSKETIEWYEAQPVPRSLTLESGRLLAYRRFVDKLMKQGQMGRALEASNQAVEIGKNLKTTDGDRLSLALSRNNRIQILLSLGRPTDALESSIETVACLNEAQPYNERCRLAISKIHNASAATRVGNYDAAVTAGEEAVRICREIMVDHGSKCTYVPLCLLGLAGVLADEGEAEKALELAWEGYNLSTAYAAPKTDTLPWEYVECDSPSARLVLATQLFATGDHEGAVGHLEELVATAQKEGLKARPGYYPLYTNALRILGWCYCSMGQHEKGAGVSVELCRLRERLRKVYPMISELVEIELVADVKRPSRLALWKKINLQCGHHRLDCEKAGE